MTFRPYKFQLVATVQEVDEHGNVVNEAVVQAEGDKPQPFVIYGGVDGLIEWAKNFPASLDNAQTPPA